MSTPATCFTMEQLSDTCVRGLVGGVWIVVLVLVFQTLLVWRARRAAGGSRPVLFMDLIVTGADNKYSLSRLQAYAWTVIIVIAFGASSAAWRNFANLPTNLWMLMGLSLGSTVAAMAINAAKTAPAAGAVEPAASAPGGGAGGAKPNFIHDIFFETNVTGSLDLPRTQMFMWTIVTMGTWMVLFVSGFPHADQIGSSDGRPMLQDVPTGMLALMGVSQGAYLGAKVATK